MVGKNKINIIRIGSLLLCGLIMLLTACSEEPVGQIPVNGNPPDVVTNVQVETIPGGATITFDLPDNEDLLYVKAVYELAENPHVETKTSLYNNKLTVEGFGDTQERQVALYAVDRSQNVSDPVYVSFTPLRPPVYAIFESLNMYEDFGGVVYSWDNETKTNISITLLRMDNSTQEYESLETLYTSRVSGVQAYRGLESKETEFGIYIRDYWGNYSDTLYTTLVPLFEMQISNDRIKALNPRASWDAVPEWGWETNLLWDESNTSQGWHTEEYSSGPLPHQFTFQYLDGPVKLSRIQVHHRLDYLYRHGNPRVIELYGKNEEPYNDEGWMFMGEFESSKPSGLPGVGDYTNEDQEYIQNGENFSIDPSFPAFQYFRVKVTKTWQGANFAHIMKLPLWGCPEGYTPED